MHFTVSTRILEHLGSDLITSNLIAFTELVKNSYDARAKEVSLHFIGDTENIKESNFLVPVDKAIITVLKQYTKKSGILIIEDDGLGMNMDEIQEGFLTIGTDIKKKSKQSRTQNNRLPLGEKGIGRLSAQRLSKVLFLETASGTDEHATLVLINWNDIIEKKHFDEIELPVYKVSKMRDSYTRLWFIDINFDFSEFINCEEFQQLSLFDDNKSVLTLKEDFETSLSFLMSPFDEITQNDEMNKKTDTAGSEKFEINVWFNDEKVSIKAKNDLLKFAEGIYNFSLVKDNGNLVVDVRLDWKPWFLERLHYRLVGREMFKDYKQEHLFYYKLLAKYQDMFSKTLEFQIIKDDLKKRFDFVDLQALEQICPIDGKVFLFRRATNFASMAIESAKEIDNIKGNYSVKNIRDFLESKNGIKLFRGNMRVATVGDKDSDWLQFQQYSTKGQQFFRMDLGNAVGYVKVNDPLQEYIREISSRLDLRTNSHSIALKKFLSVMFHEYYYEMSRSSSHIVKDIFEQENLLPRDPVTDMSEEVERTLRAIEESKNNFQEFENIIGSLKDNKDGNAELQEAIKTLAITSSAFKQKIDQTFQLVNNSKGILKRIDNQRRLVELESYNNYKLMANGLITEIITHEMHSILSNSGDENDYESYFKNLENFILKTHKNIDVYSQNLKPIHKRFKFINTRLNEMSGLYGFLEKTFIYKGTSEELVIENLRSFLANLEKRLEKRLQEYNVVLDYSNVDTHLRVPKGTLIHVFYNLIDNSLYWIKLRRDQAKANKFYEINTSDVIKIEQINPNIILYSDTGTGVLPRMEHTLFQPLMSGKEHKGRGLGLYIIRKLLGSFGATIELLHERNTFNRRYIFSLNFNTEEDINDRGEENNERNS